MDADELTSAIRTAMRALAAADVPEALQPAALHVCLERLLAGITVPAPGEPGVAKPGSGREQTHQRGAPSGETDDVLDRIARRAGVPREAIERIYHYNPESKDLELVVADTKIADSKTEGSQELTLLVVAGRQAAGLEEWTALKEARKWCDYYKRADRNYARHIAGSGGRKGVEDMTIRDSNRSRAAKMSAPAWTAWKALVKRLAP